MLFALLGPLELRDGADARVVVTGPQQRVLLAALLLHANTPVSADALVDLVWEGRPPSGPGPMLRSAVRRLRDAVGPGPAARIVARAPGYLIRLEESELDVAQFEAACRQAAAAVHAGAWAGASSTAARALGLWRDTPLLDVPCEALRERYLPRFEQLRVQALEDRTEAELHLGGHGRLIAELRDLTAQHPLRERFHAQLMLALAGAGRRAEALEAYRDAHRALSEQLGVSPGTELRELHRRILAGEDVRPTAIPSARQEPPPATAAAADAVPRQLPAAPGHFTGRQAELELLTGLVGPRGLAASAGGTVVISAIDGMAGIGKTALAVHTAHALAERFPGGQLFVDLHGYTRGYPPRDPADALAFLLRALGLPPQQIPEELEARCVVYRDRLAGSKTLVVLDNAASEAQVRPLLPGGGDCLVLITSRRRLRALDDAHTLALDLLPTQEAIELFRAVAGPGRTPADDPGLEQIARLCGRLPLALRIAAALLRHRSSWSLEHLVGKLRTGRGSLDQFRDADRDLADVFDLSYQALDADQQALLRLIALIPGPEADAHTAAALLEADPVLAERLLQDLVDHNVLAESVPGRYRLHDLIRAHARALALAVDGEPERNAALSRLLHYYAHTAQTAALPIARAPRPAPHGPAPAHAPELRDPEAARAWLRTELPNLDAAFAHARTRALHEHTLALAAALAEVLRSDGPWTRALEVHQAAADTAEHQGDFAAHATALNDLGRVRQLAGDFPAAADALARALEIYRQVGNRLGEANALADLAQAWYVTGDYPAAADALAQALEIYRQIGNRLGEATALNYLGRVRYMTGELPAVTDALARALEIYRQIGNRLGEANALNDLGRVRHLTADYPAAADALARALEIYRQIGNRTGEANVLIELGRVRYLTGGYPAAADALARALEIYRQIGNRCGEANALTDLGRVRYLTGGYPAAADAQRRALEIYRQDGNRSGEAWALNCYAATLAAAGDRPGALALYRQALAMNRELNKPDDEAIALEGIGECRLATGETQPAIADLHHALEIFQRLGMTADIERLRTRLANLATA